jgi:hypothetical protein
MSMLLALPDAEGKEASEATLRWYQLTRGLKVDGVAGPETRRQLITEYMALDGTSLGTDEFAIEITTHVCGETCRGSGMPGDGGVRPGRNRAGSGRCRGGHAERR